MEQGHVYGVPFQNSTPLLLYSVDAFRQAGLDPDRPPATWQEWVDALRKLTKRDGDSTTCWGVNVPVPTTTLAGSPVPSPCQRRRGTTIQATAVRCLYRAVHNRRGEADQFAGPQMARHAGRR